MIIGKTQTKLCVCFFNNNTLNLNLLNKWNRHRLTGENLKNETKLELVESFGKPRTNFVNRLFLLQWIMEHPSITSLGSYPWATGADRGPESLLKQACTVAAFWCLCIERSSSRLASKSKVDLGCGRMIILSPYTWGSFPLSSHTKRL